MHRRAEPNIFTDRRRVVRTQLHECFADGSGLVSTGASQASFQTQTAKCSESGPRHSPSTCHLVLCLFLAVCSNPLTRSKGLVTWHVLSLARSSCKGSFVETGPTYGQRRPPNRSGLARTLPKLGRFRANFGGMSATLGRHINRRAPAPRSDRAGTLGPWQSAALAAAAAPRAAGPRARARRARLGLAAPRRGALFCFLMCISLYDLREERGAWWRGAHEAADSRGWLGGERTKHRPHFVEVGIGVVASSLHARARRVRALMDSWGRVSRPCSLIRSPDPRSSAIVCNPRMCGSAPFRRCGRWGRSSGARPMASRRGASRGGRGSFPGCARSSRRLRWAVGGGPHGRVDKTRRPSARAPQVDRAPDFPGRGGWQTSHSGGYACCASVRRRPRCSPAESLAGVMRPRF